MTEFDTNAKAALDAVTSSQARLAERMRWPLWRHAAPGLLMVLLLAGITLPSGASIAVSGLVLLLVFAIVRDDKKRYGMFVSGYQKGRTGWVIAIQIALTLGAMFYVLNYIDDPLGSPVFYAVAAALFVASTALSYAWEVVYRADLTGGRA